MSDIRHWCWDCMDYADDPDEHDDDHEITTADYGEPVDIDWFESSP